MDFILKTMGFILKMVDFIGAKLADDAEEYVRHDGTLSYFFTETELSGLMEKHGLTVSEHATHHTMISAPGEIHQRLLRADCAVQARIH